MEAKGYFKSADQRKHKLLKEQSPHIEVRFVFQNASGRVQGSKLSCAEWCEKHGFLYAEGFCTKGVAMSERKETEYIVIHCSATKASMNTDAKEIDRWHRQRGWRKIGYHWVIRRDGVVEEGRDLR